MHQTQQHLIDNARAWLANPQNASHPNRAEVERDLCRLEGRTPTATARHANTEAALADGIVALYSQHIGADHHQAETGFTAASLPNQSAPHHSSGSEEQLAASIIATLNAHRSA